MKSCKTNNSAYPSDKIQEIGDSVFGYKNAVVNIEMHAKPVDLRFITCDKNIILNEISTYTYYNYAECILIYNGFWANPCVGINFRTTIYL